MRRWPARQSKPLPVPFDHVLGMRNGLEGFLAGQLVDLTHLPADRLAGLQATPGSRWARAGSRSPASSWIRRFHSASAGHAGVVLIGGNDSANCARKLDARTGGAIPAVLAPKTVDNDLMETDFCSRDSPRPQSSWPISCATRPGTHSPRRNFYPLKLIEVPGRDAGWLPLSGALGFTEQESAIHPLVFVPEAPPASVDAIVQTLLHRIDTHGFAVAIVPETLRDAAGHHFGGEQPELHRSLRTPLGSWPGRDWRGRSGRQRGCARGVAARVEPHGCRSHLVLAHRIGVLPTSADARRSMLWVRGQGGVMAGIERDFSFPPGFANRYVELSEVANRVRALPRACFNPRAPHPPAHSRRTRFRCWDPPRSHHTNDSNQHREDHGMRDMFRRKRGARARPNSRASSFPTSSMSWSMKSWRS